MYQARLQHEGGRFELRFYRTERSVSVGDVIELGEASWIVTSIAPPSENARHDGTLNCARA